MLYIAAQQQEHWQSTGTHTRNTEPDRAFKILDSGLQLYKGVSLAANILLVQVLSFENPYLQHPLVPAYSFTPVSMQAIHQK